MEKEELGRGGGWSRQGELRTEIMKRQRVSSSYSLLFGHVHSWYNIFERFEAEPLRRQLRPGPFRFFEAPNV